MKDLKRYLFEYNVFKGLLIASSFYWAYRTYTRVMTDDVSTGLVMDVLMLIVSLLFLIVSRKFRSYKLVILVYSLFMLFVFVFFWYSQGGLLGSISYAYFSILSFFIAALPAKIREAICIIFCFIAVLLASNMLDGLLELQSITESSKLMLPFDFVATSLFVAIITILIKRNFDKERRLLEVASKNLQGLNSKQIIQTKALLAKQGEIESLKENLEQLVKKRTSELEKTKIELEEYAFHNAHLVRKPLSNILGLINIIELENVNIDKVKLIKLKEDVQGLDLITKKINIVLQ